MSDGRTVWWAKDSAWWRRERIVELGLEFGAEGPAVIDWLTCEAKAQNAGGWVSAGVNAVAHGCFMDVVRVCPVLSRSVRLGLLDEYSEHEGRFECRISGWRVEQERGRDAMRKAESRATTPENKGDSMSLSGSVRACPVVSDSVPLQDRREQDATATQSKDNAELRSAVTECFGYWQECCDHKQAQLTADRRAKIEARLRERARLEGGMRRAIADIRQAIEGAALSPFIDERGKRHDDIELICRKGSKLEDFMGRATATNAATVTALRPARDFSRFDRAAFGESA